MPQITPNVETFARIKVIGVGGSGQNAINHMIDAHIEGVEYICVNTDTQHLNKSQANNKIHIGKNLTRGAGAGMNPTVGEESAEENRSEIQDALKDTDMVFVACGMGGGTGTGASPVIARLSKEKGILTIGVVTRPFEFEGERRKEIAQKGIDALRKEVDALIVIPNDRLLAVSDKNVSFKQAFNMSDNILLDVVKSISDIISDSQIMNIDVADVRVVLSDAGSAYIGIGEATGDSRAVEATEEAVNSRLLDVSISGAKGVLLTVTTAPDDLSLHEASVVTKMVKEMIDSNAIFIFSPSEDERMTKGELKVTIVATGFETNVQNSLMQRNARASVLHREVPVEATPFQPIIETKNTSPIPEQPNEDKSEKSAPTFIASNPIEPRFKNTPEPVEDSPKPIEIIDDTETIDFGASDAPNLNDDDWNTRFPAFIRRSK